MARATIHVSIILLHLQGRCEGEELPAPIRSCPFRRRVVLVVAASGSPAYLTLAGKQPRPRPCAGLGFGMLSMAPPPSAPLPPSLPISFREGEGRETLVSQRPKSLRR